MDKDLKLKIKSEIRSIIEDVEYEEDQFNSMFHSNIEFKRSYYRFKTIYEKYGKEAYLKYVPYKYKKLELRGCILDKNYVDIYDHYGMKTINKLLYTQNICKQELKVSSKFKYFLIKIKKLFSKNYISLSSQTILMLPENVSENFDNENITL